MICPKCGAKVRTKDTRPHPDNTNWRKKQCEGCGYRFQTVEMTTVEFAKQIGR